MSGPKIIDIAATRQIECLRIAALCARIESRTARYQRLAAAAGGDVAINADWTRKAREQATTDRPVTELMELTRAAARQLEFVGAEMDRSRDRPAPSATLDISALRAAEDRLAGGTDDSAVCELLEKCRTTGDPAARLEIFRQARELAHSESPDPAEALLENWREPGGEISRHDAGQPHWRGELARVRAELPWLRESAPAEIVEIEALLETVENERNASRRELALAEVRLAVADLLAAARESDRREALIAEWQAAAAGVGLEIDAAAARAIGRAAFDGFSRRTTAGIEAAIREAAAAEGRREILGALSRLGYELKQGMETAFVENGRIVIRKPDDAEYGVELSGMTDPALMKTRVVRLAGEVAATADARLRDRRREESWCADRVALQTDLASRGIETTVKAARPAGAVPVERVEEAAETADRREPARRENFRSL